MRHSVLVLSLAVAVGAAVACSSKSSTTDDTGADAGDTSVIPPDTSSLPPAQDGPAGTGGNTGLPCDVQAVLENRCIACHDGQQQVALLSYANLIAPSKSDPTKTLAQLSLDRMKSTTSPMPPPPAEAPNPDEIQIFADWVNAGTPKNPDACTNAVPVPDGGTLTDGGDGGMTGTVVCTSNTTWKSGNLKSPLMNPGMACNACHQKLGGPNLAFAGTVYPTLHEPDLCNGKAPPPNLSVVVTDATGKQFPMTVNAAGNFYILARTAGRVKAPFTAVVKDITNNKTRAMLGKVTSGDCNSCHTVAGANGAPGRIEAP